ncbi:MAG TPA: LD-carboxypeptidase [Burkholderiaceae bacterium]|nr:LD-carboxypeptidase [Burkholderiaceae bacterium]
MPKQPVQSPPSAGPAPVPIYLISPSSAVPSDAPIEASLARLRDAGFAPVLDPAALRTAQRFAGSDAVRAAAFARAAAQPAGAVMITRGGYGLTRLLPSLDFRALARARKAWIGYSDFTAFQLAMLARARAVTWSGPALLDDFAPGTEAVPDETTVGALHDALAGRLEIVGFRASGPAGVDVRGTLWGGNLTVLCSLIGTPWFPKVKGGILFLEDVGEHPYRIERMLTQLLHAGVLDAQGAVLLGHVNRYRLVERDAGFDMPGVIRRLRTLTRTPIITGLPMGHASPKLTLPHGATVGLATEGRTAYLVLDEHEH